MSIKNSLVLEISTPLQVRIGIFISILTLYNETKRHERLIGTCGINITWFIDALRFTIRNLKQQTRQLNIITYTVNVLITVSLIQFKVTVM